MHGMVHTIQRIARDEAAKVPAAALGVVTSVHGRDGGDADYACTVQLRESGLVLPKVPIATGLIGVAALPAEGDLVLVVFAGDLHAPVVAGRLHSQSSPPPKNAPGELVAWLPGGEEAEDSSLQLTVRTPGDGTRKVTLLLGGDVEISLEVDDQSITLKAGEAKLALTQSSGSDGKAELAVGDSSVVIEQSGNVTVKASGTLELKANQIKLSGDTSVKVAGQIIDLN